MERSCACDCRGRVLLARTLASCLEDALVRRSLLLVLLVKQGVVVPTVGGGVWLRAASRMVVISYTVPN